MTQKTDAPKDEGLVHHQNGDPIKITDAFKCAGSGIVYAFRTQRNLKIHAVFTVLALLLGIVLQIDLAAWLAIILCIVIVVALEIMNTAIESVVDLVSPEWNELAKRAKDCAAGAVYIAAIGSVIIAAVIFIPRIASFAGVFV